MEDGLYLNAWDTSGKQYTLVVDGRIARCSVDDAETAKLAYFFAKMNFDAVESLTETRKSTIEMIHLIDWIRSTFDLVRKDSWTVAR